MTCPAEIADLPAEFVDVADATKQLALDSACAMLPTEQIVLYLGEDILLAAHINAAAHWLVRGGYATESTGNVKGERVGEVSTTYADAASSAGYWAGSQYGETVAAILARLPRSTGRSRRLPFAVT